MEPFGPFELFQRLPNSDPVWLESCPSLEIAMDRAHELASVRPGSYFVFDRQTKTFMAAERCLRNLVGPLATVTKRH